MKYRVLKETPWHNVGEVINEEVFNTVYHSIYFPRIQDICIISDHKKELFFQPIRYEKLPLDFIWDGHIYTKCMDGMYRQYRDSVCHQAMSVTGICDSFEPDNLLTKINNTTLPVFEIKRYEQ